MPQSDNVLVNHRHRGGGFKFHSYSYHCPLHHSWSGTKKVTKGPSRGEVYYHWQDIVYYSRVYAWTVNKSCDKKYYVAYSKKNV